MRKDVKRSLILWPGMATALVALITGYTIVRDISHCVGPDTENLALATQPSFEIATASVTDIKISSRGEHGRRAMALPKRVAEVLGVEPRTASASSANDSGSDGNLARTDNRRIAGMILPPWGIVIDTSPAIEPMIVGPPLAREHSIESNSPRTIEDVLEWNPPGSVLPQSNRALAKPEFGDREQDQIDSKLQAELAAPKLAMRKPATEIRKRPSRVNGWPTTTLLNTQLDSLANATMLGRSQNRDQLVSQSRSYDDARRWSQDVAATLQQLTDLPRLGHEDAETLIDKLERLATDGTDKAEKLSDRHLQIQWLQAAHGISRRVAIWKPVWQLANSNYAAKRQTRFAIAMKPEGSTSVYAAIDRVREMLPESGDAAGWDRYLLLDQISAAADSDDPQQRMSVAKRFVARTQRRGLHPLHQQWLQSESIESLRIAIQPWARGVVDYADLLSHIERQEVTSPDQAASKVADAMRTLRFVDHPTAAEVAASIDVYYRNANVRVAITDEMLQRLIPEIPNQSIPVCTQVSGSRVRGVSQITSDMKVALIPSPDRWSLKLTTAGRVQTRTTGVRGPVSVRTYGKSSFIASTPIEITPYGVEVHESVANVRGRTQLSGVETEYDGWPLVGSLVRGAVARRFDSMSGQSNRMSNRRIATAIETKVDNQFNQQVGVATERLGSAVLGPLGRLQLDPTVTDMQTTGHRLVARYRLAADDQLAAFTPRPRALRTSLVSVQLHQSAINNMLARLVPTARPMPIREAISEAVNTFGDGAATIPDDIPDDVTVQFARSRPITAEFKDDTLWITMRVVRLRRGDRLNLTKFIVRAAYRPEVDGIEARLVRDGHLRISGPGMSMRERLPIRAIFNKILSSNRTLPLTMPAVSEHPALDGLVVGQLDLRDGWIAMAITPPQADRVASAEVQVD